MTVTLIVSDLHLGARNSQMARFVALLETAFDCLILNGDTLDTLDLRRLRRRHALVLERLRTIGRERELILLRGNHEAPHDDAATAWGTRHILAQLLQVELREEHYLWVGKRCYLVLHGDQFDRSLRMTRIGDIADNFYNLLLRNYQPAAYWLKSNAKRYGGVDEVRRRAADYARNNGCQGVILGHTHYQEEQIIEGIHCLNTGSWMDQPYTYVRVEDDRVQLSHWENHSDSTNTLQGADRRPSRKQAPY